MLLRKKFVPLCHLYVLFTAMTTTESLDNMRHTLALLFWLMSCCAPIWSQGLADSVSVRLQRQLTLFPQEKVSMHVDRTVFLPGDSICMKVYAVDAATLVPSLKSQFVYVELLNNKNRSLQRKRLIASNNLYTGHINLPPDQEAGTYYLWAYSLYSAQVKNHECLIPIQVGSEKPENIAKNTAPELRFFPEGGYLVEGAVCMVGFEVADSGGDSINLSGEVVNKAGKTVSRFATKHRGMGVFPLAVEAGEQYTAVCRHANGRRFTFPLPKPQADVACLHCRHSSNDIQVSVNCGRSFADRKLHLLVHCRGRKVTFQEIKPGTVYHLSLSRLPAGVNSLLLIDDDARVLSERLVFSSNRESLLPLTIKSSDHRFGLRDSIPLELTLPGMEEGEFAFLSMSVTDDGITGGRRSPSLWSQLLLTSDLQGFIPQADYYFTPTPQTDKLDLLMLVNGWRRYDIPSVLQGKYAHPKEEHEHSQSVKGRVRAVFRNQPIDSVQVVLAIMKQKYVGETLSDSLGHFQFDNLNFTEDAEAFVYAQREKKRHCLVEVERQKSPYTPNVMPGSKATDWITWVDIDQELLDRYARDSHLLDEVVVKAKGPALVYDNPTKSLNRQQIDEGNYPDFAMLLLCTNRLSVNYGNGNIYCDDMETSGIDRLLRDRSSRKGMPTKSSLVKIYINGVHIPGVTFEDINLEDVDRVDLYLGSRALVFGLDDVGGGVLNITMRGGLSRSTENIFNNKVVRIEGYQAPAEYYFPRYPKGSQPTGMSPDVRRTLYWNPYLRMVKDTPMHLDFFSADIPTTYTVRVEGITSQGRIVSGELPLSSQ